MAGSPPLTRGKAMDEETYQRLSRITPAYAGKSGTAYKQDHCDEDHPRLRGEKSSFPYFLASHAGSPPLTRGKVIWW